MVSVYSPVGSESGILNLRIWGSFISNGGSMQITSPFWWESWIASQTGLFPFSILILHPVTKTIPPGVIFPSICPVVRSVTRPICGVAFSLIIVLLVVFKGLDYGGKSTHKESCPVEKTIDGLIDYWFKTRYLRLYTDFPALRLVLFSHK